MSSPAAKQAESEFDDLLGQLVDELAMTPASESAVALVPEPPPPAAEVRVDSTHQLAAEAAAAAQARVVPSQPANSNNLVKIVGIIAGSLTVVAVAALVSFGLQSSDPGEEDDAMVASESVESERLAELARAEHAAVERAEAERRAAERAEIAARKARVEAQLLAEDARKAAEAKPKPKAKPKPRAKPKSKPKPKVRDAFEDL
ncbi:MAG: hypothetical protein R6X02_08795 [Enhygromyxa sp.]